MPLNFTLASRNLFHDRLRFVATMVGIVFSVVLVERVRSAIVSYLLEPLSVDLAG